MDSSPEKLQNMDSFLKSSKTWILLLKPLDENIPKVKGTMYSRAGCPFPSVKLSTTYVVNNPAS